MPEPLPPLNPITHRRFEPAAGVTAEAITYATQAGMRVPAILYMPKPIPKTATGRIPAFIIVNGHGGDKYSWYSYFITRPVAIWLEKHLDMPNWTAESLAAMPTTHITEWAQKHNIYMDKLYATEEREGGTDALGDDIPGFQREDLSVFTPEQWLSHKNELIFEIWADAARSKSQ